MTCRKDVSMKKSLVRSLLALLAAALLLFALWCGGVFGMPRQKLMDEFSAYPSLPDGWNSTFAIGDELAACIRYKDGGPDCTASIYINRPGLSFGWFFRYGGSVHAGETTVEVLYIEGVGESVLLCPDGAGVSRLEAENASQDLPYGHPFALVLPADMGAFTLYDAAGNEVEYLSRFV